MRVKSVLNDITSFFLDPSSSKRTPAMQALAWVSTVALGVFTIGIGHGLSALWRKVQKVERNETQEKIVQLFHTIFVKAAMPTQNTNTVSQETAQAMFPEKEVVREDLRGLVVDIAPEPPKPTEKEVVDKIFADRKKLWKDAKESNPIDRNAQLDAFILSIETKLNACGSSFLQAITENTERFDKFSRKSSSFRAAIFRHATTNLKDPKLKIVLDRHLIAVAHSLCDRAIEFQNQVKVKEKIRLSDLRKVICDAIKVEFRSLEELLANEESKEIIQQMPVLKYLFQDSKKQKKQSTQQKIREIFKNIVDEIFVGKTELMNGEMTDCIDKIRNKFHTNGVSWSTISQYPDIIDRFLADDKLRPALVEYAKLNNLQKVLDKHLIFLANKILKNRKSYWAKVQQDSESNILSIMTEFMTIINKELAKEGRTLEEILVQPEALNIFHGSETLKGLLQLYELQKAEVDKRGDDEWNDEAEEQDQVIGLAKQHGEEGGPGLLTQVHLEHQGDNEGELRDSIKKLLLKHHPDRPNHEDNPEMVKKLNEILFLIKNKRLKNYIKLLKQYQSAAVDRGKKQ